MLETANTFACHVVRTGTQFEAWFSVQWRAEPRAVLDRDGRPKRYGDRFDALRAANDALCRSINSPVRSEAMMAEADRVFPPHKPKAGPIVHKQRVIPAIVLKRKAS